MKLALTQTELAFQTEVRELVDAHWPVAVRGRAAANPADRPTPAEQHWHESVCAHGWSVPSWPVAYGGTGWTEIQHYLWERETSRAGCPAHDPPAKNVVGPAIYTWGSAEQCERFLPPIRQARSRWCLGFSEPAAGSDLQTLATCAVRDGTSYVVDGTKTWISGAEVADWMLCLVRPEPRALRPQRSASFLLIDMRSPGVEVHAIPTLTAQRPLNSVSLHGVRVPLGNRVGDEHRGFEYARELVARERGGIVRVGRACGRLARVKELMETAGGAALLRDAAFRRRVAEVEVELLALEMTSLRARMAPGDDVAPWLESSIAKLKGTELAQRVDELAVEALGYYAMPYPEAMLLDNEGPVGPADAVEILTGMLDGRGASIGGGSTEIQKNIVARAVLER